MPLAAPARLSRRHFLAGASALGLATGLAPPRLVDVARAQAPAISGADWASLARSMSGPLLRPGDAWFPRYAQPFNTYYDTADRQPDAIALCASAKDVAMAVRWAADRGRSPVVRGGGHSYAGYSMGTGLMIDVSLLGQFSWDDQRTTLTVQSGARNGDVYNVLRAENRTVTHGRCPTVGVAGFLLGGGIGFNMRRYGIGSDLLQKTDIVTADGQLRHVSAAEHDDLLWACRGGGGGNFGVNTSFTLETRPVGGVTVFSVQWNGRRDAVQTLAQDLMALLDRADNNLGSRFKFYRDRSQSPGEDAAINLIGQYHGDPAIVDTLLAPVLKRSGVRALTNIQELAYWDGQDFLKDWDGPFRFHERSLFITDNLDGPAIAAAFDALWNAPGSADKALYPDMRFFQTGGAVNARDAADTAFVHRDSRWLLDIGLPWSAGDGPDWIANAGLWLDGLFATMLRMTKNHGGSYQNFIDPQFKSVAEWSNAYYGKNFTRLQQVKRKYDPSNLFRFEQSIPPPA